MPILDRPDLKQIPTVPDNSLQPPRFGGITELVKDAFILEIRHFLKTNYTQMRIGELPRVDKYSVALDVSVDPLETAISLVRSYPDITEDLPLIAVLATTGRNLKLGMSDTYTSITVPAAKVASATPGPYVLADGMTLTLTTQPDGIEENVATSTYVFRTFMFTDITQATASEVARAINAQALYSHAYTLPSDALAIRAGGPNGTQFPNKLTLTGGTALSALGFTLNQTDQNYGPGKKAYQRHHMSAELTVALEVVAESENIRTEVSDLVYDFLAYVIADRRYQFYGRSVFDDTIPDENYQIILRDAEMSFTGEQEIPRSGDKRDKLYINRISIPVTAIQYSDRIITHSTGVPVEPVIHINLELQDDLPEPN